MTDTEINDTISAIQYLIESPSKDFQSIRSFAIELYREHKKSDIKESIRKLDLRKNTSSTCQILLIRTILTSIFAARADD